ncbi:MAG: glycosyltransferase [Muribaculaceae bacterium]|nr:glycosyltransferase [Muribaculaceae bacterium]
MFSINIPVYCWILFGLQLIILFLVIFLVLRPLRLIRKLPIFYIPESTPIQETEVSVKETATPEPSDDSDDSDDSDLSDSSDSSELSESSDFLDNSDSSELSDFSDNYYPKVSVVVYSTVNEDILSDFLETVCRQDYPDYEVIVVCDTSFEESEIVSEKYADQFKKVYFTFIPAESHNLSRRKLALTLGIKAAKGEIVLTTVANAEIPSDQWISTLVSPFIYNPQIELSLGYSHPDYQEISSPSRNYKEFFSLLTDTRWIGYAIMNKTYRGDGFNLAFRRDTFFRVKGYSKTMHLHTGEDDLFIHEIATPYNTAVSISPEAILTTRWGEGAKRIFNLRRSQYDFTARWLPLGPFVRAGLASTSQWVMLLLGVATSLLALPNLIPAIASFIVWLAFIICEGQIYARAAEKLQSAALSWQVPLFWLIKPFNNLWFRAAHRSSRFKNFTWQRHKHTK